jgi:hypothetical protein
MMQYFSHELNDYAIKTIKPNNLSYFYLVNGNANSSVFVTLALFSEHNYSHIHCQFIAWI